MALYEYRCKCGYEFEELIFDKNIDSSKVQCKSCGSLADRIMSSFSPVVTGGSSVEPVDMSIGREADKLWQSYTDRQSKRRNGAELKILDLPKTKEGKYMPVMALGDSGEKSKRKEYVGALQEHRKERSKRGLGQFDGPGSF
jgi:putative FmdB family regulatory protein